MEVTQVEPVAQDVVLEKKDTPVEKKTQVEDPSWLASRLERERRSILKDLGVESLEDIKAAIEAKRAAEEAAKTDAQKRGELEATLKTEREEKKALAEAVSAIAEMQLSGLSDAQKQAVLTLAGDDPAKQIKAISALKATWASSVVPATEPVKATMPVPSAPKGEKSVNPPDNLEIYENLKQTNPILASRFALANDIFSSR